MVESLLYALIVIAILGVIVWAILSVVPGIPPPVKTVIYAVAAIVMLVVLLNAVVGKGLLH